MKLKTKGLNPSKKFFKYTYIKIMLIVVGRAMQAAYKHDKIVQKEIASLPENATIALTIFKNGPSFVLRKEYDKKGLPRLNYIGSIKKNQNIKIDNIIKIKSINAAFKVLTFQESSTRAEAYSRYIIDGPLENVCVFMRVLDRVEILLLPRFIAKLAVKRYQSRENKHLSRIKVYIGIITGSKKGAKL